jgi:hypothetical protein
VAYTDKGRWPIYGVDGKSCLALSGGSAGDAIYTYKVPTGSPGFYLQAVETEVSTQFNTTGAPAITINRTPSGGALALLKTCTAWATGNAVGHTHIDQTPPVTATTNLFSAGDTLTIKKSVLATTAGKINICLHVSDNR